MAERYHVTQDRGAVLCGRFDCQKDPHFPTVEEAYAWYDALMKEGYETIAPKLKKVAKRTNERPSKHPVEYIRVGRRSR